MVKINLLGQEITFEIITSTRRNKKITVKNGIYDNRYFSNAVITEHAVILEGDENLLIESEVCAVYVTVASIKDRIANILQDDTVYLSPNEAIPEGKERELLMKLIED
ncbi:MAG: hypothetical protein ACP5HC_02365 [Caldisericum sp.]